MQSTLLIVQLIAFAEAWWLGLYLLGRDPANRRLRFTGLGLATYALGLGADILAQSAGEPALAQTLARWGWPLLFLPAFFWMGSLVFLLPEGTVWRIRLARPVSGALVPGAILLFLLAGGVEQIVAHGEDGLEPGPWYGFFAAAVFVDLLAALVLVLRSIQAEGPRRPRRLILIATLFFGLGTGLILFPLDWLPHWLLLLAIGLDLTVLGLAIGLLDAFDLGEAFFPDFLRSLAFSSFAAALFGGQVALVILLSTGATTPMLVLLLATVATAVAIQTLADPIQALLDRLALAGRPRVRIARANYRAAASAASRADDHFDPMVTDDAQFARLTRRALSHMGNLPRLAASPLNRLAIVDIRLSKRGASDNTLERAAELKALLTESIEGLKPRQQGDFGTSDAWRHYNALYFPYVAGLKPYSRRANQLDLDPVLEQARNWFQSQVPERTLYNWQKAAAQLVAQDLKERSNKALEGDGSSD